MSLNASYFSSYYFSRLHLEWFPQILQFIHSLWQGPLCCLIRWVLHFKAHLVHSFLDVVLVSFSSLFLFACFSSGPLLPWWSMTSSIVLLQASVVYNNLYIFLISSSSFVASADSPYCGPFLRVIWNLSLWMTGRCSSFPTEWIFVGFYHYPSDSYGPEKKFSFGAGIPESYQQCKFESHIKRGTGLLFQCLPGTSLSLLASPELVSSLPPCPYRQSFLVCIFLFPGLVWADPWGAFP